MDNSRISLIGVVCCNNCIHYIPIKKNGIKQCKGKCELTGVIKQRTDKCLKEFSEKGQLKFI